MKISDNIWEFIIFMNDNFCENEFNKPEEVYELESDFLFYFQFNLIIIPNYAIQV